MKYTTTKKPYKKVYTTEAYEEEPEYEAPKKVYKVKYTTTTTTKKPYQKVYTTVAYEEEQPKAYEEEFKYEARKFLIALTFLQPNNSFSS